MSCEALLFDEETILPTYRPNYFPVRLFRPFRSYEKEIFQNQMRVRIKVDGQFQYVELAQRDCATARYISCIKVYS